MPDRYIRRTAERAEPNNKFVLFVYPSRGRNDTCSLVKSRDKGDSLLIMGSDICAAWAYASVLPEGKCWPWLYIVSPLFTAEPPTDRDLSN